MYAVAAFYKDVMVFGAVMLQLRNHLFNIVELAEGAACAGKFGANEPHLVECELRMLVDNGLACALANGSQLEHVALNGHLVRHFHIVKVVQGHAHACWVGVVGIHNQLVVCRFFQLRAVVAGYVIG